MSDVLYHRDGSVAWITLNRPPMNALRTQTWQELGRALDRAEADVAVRVVALTGAGDRAFSAGGDLKEMRELGAEEGLAEARRLQLLMARIEHLSKPTIAAVHGYAIGGGFELAAACTLRVATDNARFGVAEVNVGFVPALGACQRLVRLIGHAWASELVLTGRIIDAAEAYRIGLANQVVPPAELRSATETLGQSLAEKGQQVLALTMAALHASHEASAAAGDLMTAALFAVSSQSPESRAARQRLAERHTTTADKKSTGQ